MNEEKKKSNPYDLAKKGIVLSNDMLSKWLLNIEERIRSLESHCKVCLRKDELARRKTKRKE